MHPSPVATSSVRAVRQSRQSHEQGAPLAPHVSCRRLLVSSTCLNAAFHDDAVPACKVPAAFHNQGGWRPATGSSQILMQVSVRTPRLAQYDERARWHSAAGKRHIHAGSCTRRPLVLQKASPLPWCEVQAYPQRAWWLERARARRSLQYTAATRQQREGGREAQVAKAYLQHSSGVRMR